MNGNILKAEDISEALKTIVTDSSRLGIDVHQHFRMLTTHITEAPWIDGSRVELVRLQQQYAKDAAGLNVREREWVTLAVRRLDEIINALPQVQGHGAIVDPNGIEQSVTYYDPASIKNLRRHF